MILGKCLHGSEATKDRHAPEARSGGGSKSVEPLIGHAKGDSGVHGARSTEPLLSDLL